MLDIKCVEYLLTKTVIKGVIKKFKKATSFYKEENIMLIERIPTQTRKGRKLTHEMI